MISPITVRHRIGQSLVWALLFLGFYARGQNHEIRLRQGTIFTPPKNPAAMVAKNAAAVSSPGLYLIQLEGPPDADTLAGLRAEGGQLIKYIPDDAFIARLKDADPETLRRLPAVRWVDHYRAEYKIHPRLTANLAAQKNKPAAVAVNILLSPLASAAETGLIRSLLARIQHESPLRQGTILRAEVSPAKLEALAQSEAVLWIEPAPTRKLYDEAASKIVGGDDGALATPTVTQQLGFDGSGVTVCVADTGLDTGATNNMHPDLAGRVTGFQFYGDLTDGSDGYGHGTHCAGIVAGNAATGETDPDDGTLYGLGIAPGANLFIERLFNDEATPANPFPSNETLTRDAVRHGAKIGSNSWGNDVQGEYDTDAAQFDELVRDADAGTAGDQPYILEFSAGNAGPGSQTIGSPATAKNVIATGASQNTPGTLAATYGLYADGSDTMADFSSRGPCADGRIKPDLVAPGTWIASAASRYALDPANTSWTVIDDWYVYMGGTSMAGPYAAGAAAVFVQFYQATHTNEIPAPALVKAALINSAGELDPANGGPGPVPNISEGWGRITLTNLITTNVNTAPRYYQYVNQTVRLTNGQVYAQHLFVQGAEQPLKITLAYTDVPGFPGALPALVNDLDLEVMAPDGTRYRGNQFGAGESVANAPSPDRINNVEGIYLSQPQPGDYLVRVRGSRIVQDALTSTPSVMDQDFALVTSGDLVRPGTGFILLDRPHYTAPGVIKLTVFDAARAASNSVSVVITNLAAHLAVTALLPTAGNYGLFTGSVATVTGPAGANQIQIANGQLLEADYWDKNGSQRTATAGADLILPGITSVAAGFDLGVVNLTWQTAEPTAAIVRYGTNSANLNQSVTNLTLVTDHVVKLTGLLAGQTYYYLIIATDAAGNSATNNNGGANFTFTGRKTPTVLLVDAYDTAVETANGATVIPDSAYTNALAAAGVSYGFWKVNERGSPQLADLTPFPVVIWRTTDDTINYGVDADGLPDPSATNNTLNAQQQYMIQTYLNGGGAFFMASMGILTQLGDGPFRRDVLQVAQFKQNTDLLGACANCDEDFGVPAFFGLPASVAKGMSVTLDYTNYPFIDLGGGDFGSDIYGPDFSDTFTPAAGATAITYEAASGKACGMSYPAAGVNSPGRMVFLSFPLDAIPSSGLAPNNAATLLRNIIDFLAPGADGSGQVTLDHSAYTTNELVTVEVGDADLAGSGQTQVTFAASSRTNRLTVGLSETTHRGLFRGSCLLVGGGATNNQLRVQHGDTITATYWDASRSSNVVATAVIDTVPPVISQVAATTDYYNARVTWQTTKPTDSAVQYGDLAQPPANSVYASALVTNHSLIISSLVPNHIYHYQVTSRDLAGNTTVEDNQGNYYTFTTLKGLTPPWFTDLEGDGTGWTVVPDPANGSDINWELGTPHNGLTSSAHSGTNAWSSNLSGSQDLFLASSFLYSPPIDLSGLKSATLTFSNVYDFSRTVFGVYYEEDGGVFISTNSSTPPSLSLPLGVDLADNTAYAWQKETVDLTPYVGKTVQLVFYYQAFAFGDTIYGWTIDDIRVTGALTGGNIVITKNLSQGTWWLSAVSPIALVPVESGNASSVILSNQPVGQYVMEFGDVPYYQTPARQTNSLADGGTLNFTGNYSFPDANSNGIPDSFEWTFFGTVSTNRTQATDTDGDGLPDYAEFIAGTDPTNAASVFHILPPATPTNGVLPLRWTTVPGRRYQMESSANLQTWVTNLTWQAAPGTNMAFNATNAPGTGRFYRVEVQP